MMRNLVNVDGDAIDERFVAIVRDIVSDDRGGLAYQQAAQIRELSEQVASALRSLRAAERRLFTALHGD